MPRRLLFLVAALAVGTACAPPPPAPDDLNELTRYLFRAQSDEDERVAVAGLLNLERFLMEEANEGEGVQFETALPERSWELEDLQLSDVESLPKRPDRPIDEGFGIALAMRSSYPTVCHGRLQIRRDQVEIEPTAKTYERSFPETDDPSCFADGRCDEIVTVNHATRANAIFSAAFVLYKNFRWVDYEGEDGEPRRALFGKSWFQDSSDTEDGEGGNQLWQSYSTDIWLDLGGEEYIRMQSLWSASTLYILGTEVSEDLQIGTVKSSINDAFNVAEDVLSGGNNCPEAPAK